MQLILAQLTNSLKFSTLSRDFPQDSGISVKNDEEGQEVHCENRKYIVENFLFGTLEVSDCDTLLEGCVFWMSLHAKNQTLEKNKRKNCWISYHFWVQDF